MELTADIFYNELVEKCKQGSALSYKKLYMQYARAMYNTCVRIVNNTADAEDIVQEAFISAFQSLDKYNYQSTFGAWIKRIIINKSINFLRDKKIDPISIHEIDIKESESDELYDEEIELKVEEIKKAVSRLPDGYRTVFTLSAFEGYDHDEIAEILHISPTTVRTQYHRAKKQLLNFLKEKP